jgi:predicted RNA-binding Zn ribbon-like protein
MTELTALRRPRHADGRRTDQQLAGALPGILAGSIARLLADEAPSSIKSCQGEGCSMHFVDRTKAQHRLYCSVQLCGNRAKVAAFRARQRGGDGSSWMESSGPGLRASENYLIVGR